jgi:hypothetical protein
LKHGEKAFHFFLKCTVKKVGAEIFSQAGGEAAQKWTGSATLLISTGTDTLTVLLV